MEADEVDRGHLIRIAITAAAYDAIASTLPEDAPLWRDGGQCLIHVEAGVLTRLRAMRRPGEGL